MNKTGGHFASFWHTAQG